MVDGTGLSISESGDLLGFSHTTISRVTKNGLKRKYQVLSELVTTSLFNSIRFSDRIKSALYVPGMQKNACLNQT